MKIISFILNSSFAVVVAAMCIGFFVGLLPLAIVCPEHGEALVRFQATGACVGVASIAALVVIALLQVALERAQP